MAIHRNYKHMSMEKVFSMFLFRILLDMMTKHIA